MRSYFLENGGLIRSALELSHAERRVHWLLDNFGMELPTDTREALEGLEKHLNEVASLLKELG